VKKLISFHPSDHEKGHKQKESVMNEYEYLLRLERVKYMKEVGQKNGNEIALSAIHPKFTR
jgi:glycerol-3-phosphate cytidylyltransferase-like family protein